MQSVQCVGDGDAQDQEASVHAGSTMGQQANQGRMPIRERILDTRGQAHDDNTHNILNSKRRGDAEEPAAAGYHPWQGCRYDSREDRSPTSKPLGTLVFS
jgi:hypothetical protein